MVSAYRPRDPDTLAGYRHEPYRSSLQRAPRQAFVPVPHSLSEVTGPGPAVSQTMKENADLTRNAGTGGEAIGERIIVTGRVLDEHGEPVRNTVLEIWQANAAGRYIHALDDHDAPLDPNFLGIGRCFTNEEGVYRFLTIRPGAYPWRNHPNAWRPAHIHLSLFGPALVTRLVTQMYFPGDPLHWQDPIFNAAPDPEVRDRLVAVYDHDVSEPGWALGYRFDIVLRGPEATPSDPEAETS